MFTINDNGLTMMQFGFKRFLALSTLTGLISISCTAYAAPNLNHSALVEKHELMQSRVTRELEFTKVKFAEAQKKLQDARNDLAKKQMQIKLVEKQLGEAPSKASLELLENDKQRLTVTELSIKSQEAALERLKRKESELQRKMESTKKQIASLQKANIASTNSQKIQAKQNIDRMAKQLALLTKENSELKISLGEEQRRRAIAEIRVEELVQASEQHLIQLSSLEEEITALTNPGKTAKAPASASEPLDLSQTILDGEAPIYQGEDGERIVIRSHNIKENVVMTQTAEGVYQADLVIEPGKAYFDLRRRRYRGTFPENFEGMYRFIYDLNDKGTPKLTVERLDKSSQVVSNASDNF